MVQLGSTVELLHKMKQESKMVDAREGIRVLGAQHSLSRQQCSPMQPSASSYLHCWDNTAVRLLTLMRVSGWSTPRTFSFDARARRFSASDSSYMPWLCSTNARLLTLMNVSGWSTPSVIRAICCHQVGCDRKRRTGQS